MSEYIIKAADWAIDYNHESLFKGCEKIVRCRDCVHYQPGYCKHFECMEHQISVIEDDFCSFGVRRNEAWNMREGSQ